MMKHLHKDLFYSASPFVNAAMIEAKLLKKKKCTELIITCIMTDCLAMAFDSCYQVIRDQQYTKYKADFIR